jgi:hypothetical protein
MKRVTTFQLRDTVMSFDGDELSHVRGPRSMLVIAQGDVDMMQESAHPKTAFRYLPDRVNDIPELLIKEYGGKMMRRAKAPKFDPDVVY